MGRAPAHRYEYVKRYTRRQRGHFVDLDVTVSTGVFTELEQKAIEGFQPVAPTRMHWHIEVEMPAPLRYEITELAFDVSLLLDPDFREHGSLKRFRSLGPRVDLGDPYNGDLIHCYRESDLAERLPEFRWSNGKKPAKFVKMGITPGGLRVLWPPHQEVLGPWYFHRHDLLVRLTMRRE